MRDEADKQFASLIIHRTDRPASELVLALHARMGQSADAAFAPTTPQPKAEASA